MRVLVTGGTGFVGSHTARALVRAGHRVRLLARDPEKVHAIFDSDLARRFDVAPGDMTDSDAVIRALEGQDALVHAAALVALGRKQAARVLSVNRRGVENVIGAAAARGIARIVYVSSAVALFHAGASSITVDSPVRDQWGESESAYSRSKAECERYVRALQARGAPIRTTYPGGVLGPDDPAMSEGNRGLLTLFRDAPVVTDGGLQMVDVRDVASAHVRLLEAPAAPARHMLGGHFLRWAELVDLFEQITGKKHRRLPVPGALLRAAGAMADVVRRVWDFELPLTREATCIMTQWAPCTPHPGDDALGITFRSARETVRDTLSWLHAKGTLADDRVGALQTGARDVAR
jgi:dihydroflavonol-4-reductase